MKTFKQIKQELFRRTSHMTNREIVSMMRKHWNDDGHNLAIEAGFKVLDERITEEQSDKLYDKLWSMM